MLAGPVGLAVGASLGALTGLIADLGKTGIDLQFVDEVSQALSPGKAAVLADVEESWTAPVEARIGKLGGLVFRRLRSEVVQDQLAREAAVFQAEVTQLTAELAQAHAENKAAIQQQIDEAKTKLQVTRDQVAGRIEQATREAEAKIAAMQEQLRQASDRQKAKIAQRIADVKADFASRGAKLQEAGRLAKEALGA